MTGVTQHGWEEAAAGCHSASNSYIVSNLYRLYIVWYETNVIPQPVVLKISAIAATPDALVLHCVSHTGDCDVYWFYLSGLLLTT